jgi:hypothetical protein
LATIEGRRNKDEITKKIMRDFDYRLIYDKMTEIHHKIRSIYKGDLNFFLFSEEQNSEIMNKIVVESGFNLYVFLSTLYNYETNEDSEFKRFYDSIKPESETKFSIYEKNIIYIKKAMIFYKENCLRIEISKDDLIQTVYFPRLNFFKNLTPEMVKAFRDRSNQTSAQTKLNAILTEKDNMYATLKQLHRVESFFNNLGYMRIFFNYPKFYLSCCIYLAILMNIFILLGYRYNESSDPIRNTNLFFVMDKPCIII